MPNRLTADRARKLLAYDPGTGTLRWRVGRSRTAAGSVAGSLNGDGYLQIKVDGRDYKAHRLAWLLAHGEFPDGDIDHINRDKRDNRLVNLRVVTGSENCHNVKMPRTNTSGYHGVSWHKAARKWRAEIRVEGKKKHLGLFATPEEAHAAYVAVKGLFLPDSQEI